MRRRAPNVILCSTAVVAGHVATPFSGSAPPERRPYALVATFATETGLTELWSRDSLPDGDWTHEIVHEAKIRRVGR